MVVNMVNNISVVEEQIKTTTSIVCWTDTTQNNDTGTGDLPNYKNRCGVLFSLPELRKRTLFNFG